MESSLYTEGELMTIHNDFHHAYYQRAIDFDASAVSAEAALPARVLQLRAQIALGQAAEVLADVEGEEEVPELAAVAALAHLALGGGGGGGSSSSSETEAALKTAEELAAAHSDNPTVQVLAGTVLQALGKGEEALALLSKHQGSLEAVALIVQIHLVQNRTDLALKEVQSARKWAQDSLLVNIAESWVGLRIGGDKYQQAFYEFEEMPVHQAIAELHLGRLPEAEAALQQVLQSEPDNVEAIANAIVLNSLAGKKEAAELTSNLESKAPDHPLLTGLQEKSNLFDEAAKKYAPKVATS